MAHEAGVEDGVEVVRPVGALLGQAAEPGPVATAGPVVRIRVGSGTLRFCHGATSGPTRSGAGAAPGPRHPVGAGKGG